MSRSGELNVTAAGALVLGGIAAMILALAVVLGGYGHGASAKVAVSLSAAASRGAPESSATPEANASSDGAVPEAEGEYLLDTSEPTKAPQLAPTR